MGAWEQLPWNMRILQLEGLSDEEKAKATNLVLRLPSDAWEAAVPNVKTVALFCLKDRLANAAVSPSSQSALAKFKELLKDGGVGRLDEEAMIRLQMHFSSQLLVCESAAAAEILYRTAKNMPGTTTRHAVEASTGIQLDGAMSAQNHASSVLIYAWKDGLPKLLKIPQDQGGAEKEVGVWQKVSTSPSPSTSFIVGPMDLVALHGGQFGVLMPVLPFTLEQAPRPMKEADVLMVCKQLSIALTHFNACGLGHNDVKPSNVLVATDGTFHLCDFGSTESVGNPVLSSTKMFVPVDVARITGLKYDRAMLAMTALYQLALFSGADSVDLEAARAWARGVEHMQLREMLLSMLSPA